MALIWQTRTMTVKETEGGCGNWEPFAVVVVLGNPMVLCKSLMDVERDPKATEISGESLGNDW